MMQMYIYNWFYKIYKNGYFPSILSKAINRTLNLHNHTLCTYAFVTQWPFSIAVDKIICWSKGGHTLHSFKGKFSVIRCSSWRTITTFTSNSMGEKRFSVIFFQNKYNTSLVRPIASGKAGWLCLR